MDDNLKLKNTKLMIIYGEKEVDGKNRNGEVEIIKKEEGDNCENKNIFPHYQYMNQFLKTHFKDSKILQKYANSKDIGVLFFLLANEGHVSMAETSYPSYNSMLISMPRNIDEKQRKALESIKEELKKEKYEKIDILYKYTLEDGIIGASQVHGNADILDKIISIETKKEYFNR